MQQTVDVVVETKEQIVAVVETDSDLATIHVSGLSYFFYAVVVTLLVLDAADAVVAMTAACGSSSCCSSAAALAAITEAVADAVATTVATRGCHSLKASASRQELYIFHLFFS